MLENRVNICHKNHACVHSATEFIFEDKILCISGVPVNDFAPMKNCPGGCKIGRISSRGNVILF